MHLDRQCPMLALALPHSRKEGGTPEPADQLPRVAAVLGAWLGPVPTTAHQRPWEAGQQVVARWAAALTCFCGGLEL